MKSHARSVLFLTLSLLLIPLCPRPADAHALTIEWLPLLGLNVGWEDMLLKSDEYKTNNHGLMFTLSGGLALTKIGKMLAGFHLEQDLGFIDLRLKDDAMDALDAPASQKLFKGATFAGVHGLMLPDFELLPEKTDVIFSPKLNIGAVYMKAPEGAGKSVQAWFAIRPAVSISIWPDPLPLIGLEFDYTLGISPPNVFDHSRVTHFVSVKFKVWI